MSNLEKVRIDKWLWSVRIFKSRTLATNACKGNDVKVNEVVVKSSYQLERGTTVVVRRNGFHMIYKVIDLLEKRVSANLAEVCYENLTPQEELDKYKNWYVGKAPNEKRARGEGRPTKRERRSIDKWKVKETED